MTTTQDSSTHNLADKMGPCGNIKHSQSGNPQATKQVFKQASRQHLQDDARLKWTPAQLSLLAAE